MKVNKEKVKKYAKKVGKTVLYATGIALFTKLLYEIASNPDLLDDSDDWDWDDLAQPDDYYEYEDVYEEYDYDNDEYDLDWDEEFNCEFE